MTFINQSTFKCLLGKRSKNIQINNNIYSWEVGKKKHFCTDKKLDCADLQILNNIGPSNFHYLSEDNLFFLKKNYKVKKVKNKSVIINLQNFTLDGGINKKLRQTFNKCCKNDLELLENYKKIEDVEKMLDEWSNNYTEKYFRDFSGKNLFFYKNNFHLNCLNLFVYHGNDLVSFGTLSQPEDGKSSYIIGKALFKRFYGLSEYTDIMLYFKGVTSGVMEINLGQAMKGLLFYKNKFPNSREEVHYDGSIEI